MSWGVDSLSNVISGPIGGIAADRWQRKTILAYTQFIKAIIVLLFSYAVIYNQVNPMWILVFVVSVGFWTTVSGPSGHAIVPSVLPINSNLLVSAFAIIMAAEHLSGTLIPPIAGKMISIFGPGPTLISTIVLLILGGFTYLKIQPLHLNTQVEKEKINYKDLFKFLKRSPLVQAMVISRAWIYLFIVPALHGLLPIFAAEELDTTAFGLGLLFAALGSGGVIGNMGLTIWNKHIRKNILFFLYWAIASIAMILFAYSKSLFIALPAAFFVNFGIISTLTIIRASLASEVPDKLRGRVSSLNSITMILVPVGSLIAGSIAERYDAPTATLLCSVFFITSITLTLLTYPQIRRFE
tara:strand:+ start:1286 stop:2347 length:1062 start_codon:yes stop_codon:yes gene_type:complete